MKKLIISPIFIGALISVVYLLYGIFTSTSSTAAIGFIFVPVFALIGALIGGLLEHVFLLIRKKRELVSKPTAFYSVVLLIFVAFAAHKFQEKKELMAAGDPNTDVFELRRLLEKKDSVLQRALLANPSLPQDDVKAYFDSNKTKYDVVADIIEGPHLTSGMVNEIVQFVPESFASKVEYELYQTFVWAPLIRKKKVTAEQVHLLATKPKPEHFLILALLGSNELTCEEKRKFLPQPNQVLEYAIQNSLTQSGCP